MKIACFLKTGLCLAVCKRLCGKYFRQPSAASLFMLIYAKIGNNIE